MPAPGILQAIDEMKSVETRKSYFEQQRVRDSLEQFREKAHS